MKNHMLMLILLFCVGCASQQRQADSVTDQTDIPSKEHTVLAVLWQQNSAEYRALCYQAYNLAHKRLKEMVSNNTADKPLAIITDIDETVLDNSPYSAELIDSDSNYAQDSWVAWGKKESAELVPGAAGFFKAAQQLGVTVFYVSNRYDRQAPETLNNLQKFQLPNADAAHLFLKTDTSGKEPRRQQIIKNHEVLLLLGDNLSDFHAIFDDQNSAQRNQHATDMQPLFGDRFIVFPNPMYGDWEVDGIYDGQRLSEAEKRAVRRAKLKR